VKRPVVAVVGLGLIGGSLARVLGRAGYRVLGSDRAPVLRAARKARAIAGEVTTLEEAARSAGVVVLAASPETNRRLPRRLARTGTGAAMTDVGSVKVSIVAEAERLGLS